MTMTTNEPQYSLRQAAQLLDVGHTTVQRVYRKLKIQGTRYGNGIFISEQQFKAIKSHINRRTG